MHPDLSAALLRFEADLRAGDLDRAALFWLKTFVGQALAGGGVTRSDRWVEAGLAAAQETPGLSATSLEPRQRLVADYGLFRFVRLKDEAEFSGGALATLDWQRKYRVSLLAIFAADLPALAAWVEARWSLWGGVDPQMAALEKVLARPGGAAPAAPTPAPTSSRFSMRRRRSSAAGCRGRPWSASRLRWACPRPRSTASPSSTTCSTPSRWGAR